MGELFRIVELGGSYYLEYMNDSTGWAIKVKELSPSDVTRYEDLMDKLSSMETDLLKTFVE